MAEANAQNASYRTLDASRIVETLERLEARIAERFPASGLRKVCRELVGVARSSAARATAIKQPNAAMRLGIFVVIVIGLAAVFYVGSIIEYKKGTDNLYGVLQGIDALFNVVLLLGGAIFFLSTIESRWKRHRALEYLHELRSVIHVIDMHQLTKDPSVTLNKARRTKSSPERAMTSFELVRYLDYCSEMLSLAAKVAVLYAQSSRDTVVINAVTEIEQISANLSAKVWQKITLIQGREAPSADNGATVAATVSAPSA
jgi:hypothetical protein